MADELPYFSKDDAGRISESVHFTEDMNRRGAEFFGYDPLANPEVIYVKLTEKDAGGAGYWKGEEVRYQDNDWEIVDEGRKWDDEGYPYIRHYTWDDAEKGQIVKAHLNLNRENGQEEWVFTTNVTNPEGLVFYAEDNGGTGQARNDSTWKTKVGAKVLTNVGQTTLQNEFSLTVGQRCQVIITFIDSGNGYILAGAILSTGSGPYWTESNGVIIVNWPVAEVEAVGEMGRLKQYHSGDIHLEVFGFGADDDEDPAPPDPYTQPIDILGDDKWIDVTRAGNTYTVSHRKPNPKLIWKTIEVLKNGGGFHTIEIDRMGHVYSVDGEILPEEDENYFTYTSTLTSDLVGSDIRPEAVGGAGVTVDYRLFEDGNNFLDFVQTRKYMIAIQNDIGEPISFSNQAVADGAMSPFLSELIQNNNNTGGINIPELYLAVQNFRFNASITVSTSVVGRGFAASQENNTATCTPTHTNGSTVVRDQEDPNNTPFTVQVSYSLTNLDSDYKTLVEFHTEAGIPVPFQRQNQLFIDGGITSMTLDLDATSATTEQTILFDFESMGNNKPEPGDVILMTSTLLSQNTSYDANASLTSNLNYMSDGDYVLDENGQIVTDGDDSVTVGIPQIHAASCAYPGTGASLFQTTTGNVNSEAKWSITNGSSFAAVRSELNKESPSLGSGSGNTSPRSVVDTISNIDMDRGIVEWDVSSGLAANLNVRITFSFNSTYRPKLYIMATTDAIASSSNKTYDVPTWTAIGYVDTTGFAASTTSDFDISGLLTAGNNQQIGLLWAGDYDGDFSDYPAALVKVQADMQEFYQC